jgi:hypothetical protein
MGRIPTICSLPTDNPVRKAYETIYNGINGRDSWDQCAVVHAVRGLAGYWTGVTVGANRAGITGHPVPYNRYLLT